MEYLFRRATETDIIPVFQLYKNRVQWMEEKGLHQWNKTDYLNVYPINYYQKQSMYGNLYVLENKLSAKIAGAVVLLHTDERWNHHSSENAYYIHNLVTDIYEHNIGKKILLEIEHLAIMDGKSFVRLDCAENNAFLNDYYASMGYLAVDRCHDGLYVGITREKKLS